MKKSICYSIFIALFVCLGSSARGFPIRTSSAGSLFEEMEGHLFIFNSDDSWEMFHPAFSNAITSSLSRALLYFLADEMDVNAAFPVLSINSKWTFHLRSWFHPSLQFSSGAHPDTPNDRLPLDESIDFDFFFLVASALGSDPFSIWTNRKSFLGTRRGEGGETEHRQSKSTSIATQAKVLSDVKKRPITQKKNRYHEVRRGETLYRIAKKYGISVKKLCRLNDMDSNEIIQPNQKLLVLSEKNE